LNQFFSEQIQKTCLPSRMNLRWLGLALVVALLVIAACLVYNTQRYSVQGVDPHGVVAYISYGTDAENHVKGVYTGLQWQCVEYARRWLILVKGVTFESVDNAANMWPIKYATSITDGSTYDFVNVSVASATKPPPVGALLIYRKTDEFPHGHVAVVVEEGDDQTVGIAEQNQDDAVWKGPYSRRINVFEEKDLVGWKILQK
jgi:hypothetical protein